MFPKLLGRPAGRSPGVLGTSWGPVGLGKLVDSMTSKLPPATRLSFGPVLRRSGSARLVPRSKNAQKTEDNARFDSKNAVFWAEMDDSLTQVGRPWLEVHPGKSEECQKCHSQAQLGSKSPRSLATHPFGGPMQDQAIKQEDVIENLSRNGHFTYSLNTYSPRLRRRSCIASRPPRARSARGDGEQVGSRLACHQKN